MANYVSASTKIKKIQKYLLSKINYRLLRKFLRNDQVCVLDFGCGAGDTLVALSKFSNKLNLTGCDINSEYINYARSRVTSSVNIITNQDLKLALSTKPRSYDVIVCLQVIEHINDPSEFYSFCDTALKPGGILFVTTPNLSGIAPKLIGNKWHGFDDEEHVNLYTKERLEREIKNNNYDILFSGSSFLSGLPMIKKTPLRIINDFTYFILGYQGWNIGDSLAVIAKKI